MFDRKTIGFPIVRTIARMDNIYEVVRQSYEAPRSKLRGIKAELHRSLTRLRSDELRRGSPCLSSLQQAAGYSGEGE